MQYTSRPLAAAREDLSQKSLGEALEDLLPEYFEVGSRDNSNIRETASVSAATAAASDERQTQAGSLSTDLFEQRLVFLVILQCFEEQSKCKVCLGKTVAIDLPVKRSYIAYCVPTGEYSGQGR